MCCDMRSLVILVIIKKTGTLGTFLLDDLVQFSIHNKN